MSMPQQRELKKPYSNPTLTIYGSIQNLTQNTNKKGKTDVGANKT